MCGISQYSDSSLIVTSSDSYVCILLIALQVFQFYITDITEEIVLLQLMKFLKHYEMTRFGNIFIMRLQGSNTIMEKV